MRSTRRQFETLRVSYKYTSASVFPRFQRLKVRVGFQRRNTVFVQYWPRCGSVRSRALKPSVTLVGIYLQTCSHNGTNTHTRAWYHYLKQQNTGKSPPCPSMGPGYVHDSLPTQRHPGPPFKSGRWVLACKQHMPMPNHEVERAMWKQCIQYCIQHNPRH